MINRAELGLSLFSLMNPVMQTVMAVMARQMLNSSRSTDMREVRSVCVYLDSSHHQPQCSQLKGKSGSDSLLLLLVVLVVVCHFHNFPSRANLDLAGRSKAITGYKEPGLEASWNIA